MARQLHLNAFLFSCGHHEAAWRLPASDPLSEYDIDQLVGFAQLAERGKFDSVFLADHPGMMHDGSFRPAGALEPTIVLTMMAARTQHIGLIATASTSYNHPFNLARRFASLDHVSGGRAGWNIVTTASADAARNFGLDDRPEHALRYRRAAEFLDVATALWDSWEDDAIQPDVAAGRWADPDRIHTIDHDGEFFRVRGPLNVPRSPQGHPLLVQAGSSEDGREFAARYAEAIFTAQQTLADGQEFYADIRQRARQLGRDPDSIKILPGLVPVVGSTEAEAEELQRQLDEAIIPEYGRARLSRTLEIPVELIELDKELPYDQIKLAEVQGSQSRSQLVVALAWREHLSVRQLLARLGGGRGHRTFVGAPEQVADTIQQWFENGAADGFNVMAPLLPSSLEAFIDHVVPVLVSRGLFRSEYSGATLRDHYGVGRPQQPRREHEHRRAA